MSKTYRLRIRRYPGQQFVSVWLERGIAKHGPFGCVLWGEMQPRLADELATALGLPVEYEDHPMDFQPMTAPGCVPVAKQGELFPEEATNG